MSRFLESSRGRCSYPSTLRIGLLGCTIAGMKLSVAILCAVLALAIGVWALPGTGLSPMELIVMGSVTVLVAEYTRSIKWRFLRCPNCGQIRSRLRTQPCPFCGHRLV